MCRRVLRSLRNYKSRQSHAVAELTGFICPYATTFWRALTFLSAFFLHATQAIMTTTAATTTTHATAMPTIAPVESFLPSPSESLPVYPSEPFGQ